MKQINSLIPIQKCFLKNIRNSVKQKGETPVADPMFAIVCASDSTILSDVKVIVDTLIQKGYKAIYADPREFAYDGKHVTKDGKIVHVIYRDAVRNFSMNLTMDTQMQSLKPMKTEISVL